MNMHIAKKQIKLVTKFKLETDMDYSEKVCFNEGFVS